MEIVKSDRFNQELFGIMEYIARDNLAASLRFQDNLTAAIIEIPNFPYKHRKSTKFDDKNIRDLIFNGYVIPYLIQEDKITILGIFNQNKWDNK